MYHQHERYGLRVAVKTKQKFGKIRGCQRSNNILLVLYAGQSRGLEGLEAANDYDGLWNVEKLFRKWMQPQERCPKECMLRAVGTLVTLNSQVNISLITFKGSLEFFIVK